MPNNNNSGNNMVGWVYFAGIIMILRGLSEAFLGISALVNKHYLLVSTNNNVIYSLEHYNAWGWVQLAVGVLVLAAGWSLLHSASNWARVVAIIFTGLMFLVNVSFLTVFPLWSILSMILDVVIIYALVIQGNND